MVKGDKKDESRKKNGLYNKELLKERLSDFNDDVHHAGKKFGERAKRKDITYDNWFYRTFGVVGPLFSSVFGLIVLLFLIWMLDKATIFLGNSLLFALHDFMYSNLESLFLVLLFFSYTAYFSRHQPKLYVFFSPISRAAGMTVFLWIIAGSIQATGFYRNNDIFSSAANFITSGLFWLFAFFVLVGYMALIIKFLIDEMEIRNNEIDAISSEQRSRTGSYRHSPSGFKGRRIYRSGQDRILGGVCGGIADYLGVDPVLIRIVWLAGTIAWWPGLVAYLIFWIIVPRNPRENWN